MIDNPPTTPPLEIFVRLKYKLPDINDYDTWPIIETYPPIVRWRCSAHWLLKYTWIFRNNPKYDDIFNAATSFLQNKGSIDEYTRIGAQTTMRERALIGDELRQDWSKLYHTIIDELCAYESNYE